MRRAIATLELAGAVVVVRRPLVPALLTALEAAGALVVDVEHEGDHSVQTIAEALAIQP